MPGLGKPAVQGLIVDRRGAHEEGRPAAIVIGFVEVPGVISIRRSFSSIGAISTSVPASLTRTKSLPPALSAGVP